MEPFSPSELQRIIYSSCDSNSKQRLHLPLYLILQPVLLRSLIGSHIRYVTPGFIRNEKSGVMKFLVLMLT